MALTLNSSTQGAITGCGSCSSGGGKRRKGRKGRKSGKKRRAGKSKKSCGCSFKLFGGKRRTRKGGRLRRTHRNRRNGGSCISCIFNSKKREAINNFKSRDNLIELIENAATTWSNWSSSGDDVRVEKLNFIKNESLLNIDEIFEKFKELPDPTYPIIVSSGNNGTDQIFIQYNFKSKTGDKKGMQFNIMKDRTTHIIVDPKIQP